MQPGRLERAMDGSVFSVLDRSPRYARDKASSPHDFSIFTLSPPLDPEN
jgi:hypothetical protein